MPPSLRTRQKWTAISNAAAKGTAAGVITLRSVMLAEGMLRAMILAKTKLAAVVLLAVGLVVGGAGILTHRILIAQSAEPYPMPQSAAIASRVDPPESDEKKPARTDGYGDPLPPGALARIGTLRWRLSRLSSGRWVIHWHGGRSWSRRWRGKTERLRDPCER